jgi:YidC/Oxa1 family membrane protein insertase
VDKRFTLFIVLSVTIMVGFVWLNNKFMPPLPPVPPGQGDNDVEIVEGDGGEGQGEKDDPDNGTVDAGTADDSPGTSGDEGDPPDAIGGAGSEEAPGLEEPSSSQHEWVVVGSFDGRTLPYVAYFSNLGASLDRLELVERRKDGRFVYKALEHRNGYLGFMGLDNLLAGGCLVRVVAPGTPVDLATSPSVSTGVQPGDIILAVEGTDVSTAVELERVLARSKVGDKVTLSVRRPAKPSGDDKEVTVSEPADDQAQSQDLIFTVVLSEKPLALISDDSEDAPPKLRSAFTLAISQFRDRSGTVSSWETAGSESLATKFWDFKKHDDTVVFSTRYANGKDVIEVEKTFRFSLPTGIEKKKAGSQYRFDYQIRARTVTVTDTAPLVAFRIDGPRGLPTEGWWYINKIHPRFFASAGTRDVTWNVVQGGHQIRGTRSIYTTALEDDQQPFKPIFAGQHTPEQRSLRYIGVDTSYFNITLLPSDYENDGVMRFSKAAPISATDPEFITKRKFKLCDTSFWLSTEPTVLEHRPSGKWSYQQRFVVFAGPKRTEVLKTYGLDDNIYYGWFPWVAKPLSFFLHFFYALVGNYGVAIVMLTVLVRAGMFPLSRKAARNAQIMQLLAPEMKKLTEKYKGDMEKRSQAQRELYNKYDFNPFGGCGLMFLQLPIFMGLYRCISVDIDLRQAALIPGLTWCSNMAGPDMLWEWPAPLFLSAKTGWLGPFLNVLPLVTIVLFLVQQKMFTPPATDDQTRMQQSMMKYMMIFIGVMFFKVPAGLCIYFISSSLWGIAERKLIPKGDVDLEVLAQRALEKKQRTATTGTVSPRREAVTVDGKRSGKSRKKRPKKK